MTDQPAIPTDSFADYFVTGLEQISPASLMAQSPGAMLEASQPYGAIALGGLTLAMVLLVVGLLNKKGYGKIALTLAGVALTAGVLDLRASWLDAADFGTTGGPAEHYAAAFWVPATSVLGFCMVLGFFCFSCARMRLQESD